MSLDQAGVDIFSRSLDTARGPAFPAAGSADLRLDILQAVSEAATEVCHGPELVERCAMELRRLHPVAFLAFDPSGGPGQGHGGPVSSVTVPVMAGGRMVAALRIAAGFGNGPGDRWLDEPWSEEISFLGTVGLVLAGALRDQQGATPVRDEHLAVVAHEMRNPLSVIQGFTTLLQGDDLPPKVAADALEAVARASRRLATMIDGLANGDPGVDGTGPLNRRRLDLVELVTSAAAEASLAGAVEAAGPVMVMADPDRLTQVVSNLLVNARRHGGDPVRVEVRSTGSTAEVAITDSGPGFPPELAPRLFTRNACHGPTRGSGLGLWLTKRIVEAHGGSIEAANGPAGGAVVTLRLPLPAYSSTRVQSAR